MVERFWHLGQPELTRRLAEWVDDEVELDQVICPRNPGHRRGGKRLSDLSVILPGPPVEDFVWTWYSECLIQDRVLNLFREAGLTGFEVKPVRARFRRLQSIAPPRLWELVVTGWAGMAPPESGVRLVESCPGCGLLGYSSVTNPSQLISESQWDGSDFFIVWPLVRFVFVTERAAQVVRANQLKGARLVPPRELKFSGGTIGGGRLSYWMPEERARRLGDPLGIT